MGLEDVARGEPREIRLEGGKLLAAAVVLIALLAGAFLLGRAVERQGAPTPSTAGGGDPLPRVDTEPTEATEKPTFFDTVTGPGKEAEPKREAATAAPPTATPPPAVSPGSWYVQVFVGRDRAAAEEVVRTLRGLGYPVRTDAVSEGSGSLYKVRVGGYPTKDLADAGAEKLHRDGQASTWVVKLGG
jgi:cell division septation protein DedD